MSVAWVGAGIAAVGVASNVASANKAAKAQTNAADSANATQLEMYNQTRQDQAPYRDRGNAAGDRLNYLLGLGGSTGTNQLAMPTRDQFQDTPADALTQAYRDLLGRDADMSGRNYYTDRMAKGWTIDQVRADIMGSAEAKGDIKPYQTADQRYSDALSRYQSQQQQDQQQGAGFGSLMRSFSADDFTKDPGYDFRLSEGMKGINNSAAARGGLLSGAALKAASKYNQNFASNEYSNVYNRFQTNQTNQFNRLASIAGVGQTATNQVAAAGQNTANNVSQNQLSAGNARASGYVGGANAISGGIGQAYNMYQGNQLMNMLGNRNSVGGGVGYGDTSAYSRYAPTAVTNGGWGIE